MLTERDQSNRHTSSRPRTRCQGPRPGPELARARCVTNDAGCAPKPLPGSWRFRRCAITAAHAPVWAHALGLNRIALPGRSGGPEVEQELHDAVVLRGHEPGERGIRNVPPGEQARDRPLDLDPARGQLRVD